MRIWDWFKWVMRTGSRGQMLQAISQPKAPTVTLDEILIGAVVKARGCARETAIRLISDAAHRQEGG